MRHAALALAVNRTVPHSPAGGLAFVLGFWLALQLLLPLVVPERDPTTGSVLDARVIEARSEAPASRAR